MSNYKKSEKEYIKFEIIRKYCINNDLSTFDPYDIWKTNPGIKIKALFNSNRFLGAFPALCLTLYDLLINNSFRFGYKKQEYPIARALAAQTLLNEYERSGNRKLLIAAKSHLKWLEENMSTGYSGACWGLGFKWPAFDDVIYYENTPHTTHTPYALEAFHRYTQITGDTEYVGLIKSCFLFYEKDVCVLYEDDEKMAVSYGPFKDKIVINASSYTFYVYSIFLNYFPEQKDYITGKILKLYRFVVESQNPNGSWFYSPDSNSFIDCFHSCFIIKNILKANMVNHLNNIDTVVTDGYNYIIDNFINKKHGLFKRFTMKNKLSLTKLDLYDNAEVLNLMKMRGDLEKARELEASIRKHFFDRKGNIYSVIDILGLKRNKNTLRWAVMPYLYSISK